MDNATSIIDQLQQIPLNLATIVIATVALIVPFVIYFIQKPKKRLCYDVFKTRVLSVREEIENQIKITFQEKEVSNLSVVNIKFYNNGNREIASNDFEEEIVIKFPSSCSIIGHENEEKDNSTLKADLYKEDEHSIRIGRLLINPKDTINIKLLISDYDNEEPNILARIAGVREIKNIPRVSTSIVIMAFISMISTIAGLVMYIVSYPKIFPLYKPSIYYVGWGLFIFGYILSALTLLRTRTMQRKLRMLLTALLKK